MANWRGTWSGSTPYAVDDAVTYSGTHWLSVTSNTGRVPGVTADWVTEDSYTGVAASSGSAGPFAPVQIPVRI
jgi:hypothetical protein